MPIQKRLAQNAKRDGFAAVPLILLPFLRRVPQGVRDLYDTATCGTARSV
ncbi:hypothetical protein [Paraburkholderia tagetis]|uniref:Uncharacterized protein n=1 Tax=Paraburkholderia tagetis TaxID=2913261 RepID=A0A9X1UKQ4_9BURK|nr:hypothetical protein [Paraburkholderia tagetis]MCG5075341.1 hypothetical protein [Paraburkholderia tagetis]